MLRKFFKGRGELIVSFAVTSLTLPVVFAYFSYSYRMQQADLKWIHAQTADNLELDFDGQLRVSPQIIFSKASQKVGAVEQVLRARIQLLNQNNLADFLKLTLPSDSKKFADVWADPKQKKYRALIARASEQIDYYGYIKYGQVNLAISCLKGKESKMEIVPFIEEFNGVKLVYLSPTDYTLRAINSAFSGGKLSIVSDNKLEFLPACSSSARWDS